MVPLIPPQSSGRLTRHSIVKKTNLKNVKNTKFIEVLRQLFWPNNHKPS